jgi:predicted glycosyltransferase involved in capsule biosynthesis
MNITYIIPFKYSEDRIKTLKRVLESIKKYNFEVIIVEQGEKQLLDQKDFTEKIIFIENKIIFNKSFSLNVGWKKCNGDIVIFGDADLIISEESMKDSINDIKTFEMVSPYNKVIDLTEDESKLNTDDFFNIKRHGRGDYDNQKVPLCGGITFFTKSALQKIGGWPEEFFGWGAEDDAMTIKVKHFLNWKENVYDCYHIYHIKQTVYQDFYHRNFGIYQQYLNSSKEQLLQYIEKTKNIIGDINKKY